MGDNLEQETFIGEQSVAAQPVTTIRPFLFKFSTGAKEELIQRTVADINAMAPDYIKLGCICVTNREAGGEPVGYIIERENRFKIFHMGETAIFGDMKFISEYYKPDLIPIRIGGHFTMDPVDAAYPTRELIKPKFAVPMHYGANPLGKGTPEQYIKALGSAPVKVTPLNPGDTVVAKQIFPKPTCHRCPPNSMFDGETYLSNAAAAVCAISTSLIPAPPALSSRLPSSAFSMQLYP